MTCLFNSFNLEKIKRIEKSAYPEFMWQFQDVETPEQAYDEIDCDGQFFCHIDDGWYMLGCNGANEVYIEDLASIRNLGFNELNTMLKILRGFGEKVITADCRSETSYRLLKIAERRGSIEMISERPWNWESEKMHNVVFKVKPASFREWLELTEVLDPNLKARLQKTSDKIFPDRKALEKAIKQMEDEPEMIVAKDAFARLNAMLGNTGNKEAGPDVTIQKANSINPNPSELIKELQSEYLSKQISSPEFLSLTYFSAKGASDGELRQLAQDIKSLSAEVRAGLLFKDIPNIKTANGVVALDNFTNYVGGIHALSGEGVDISKQNYFDAKTDIRPDRQKDLLIAKNGIYIYRGSNPMACRQYGKGSNWCIASSSSTTWYFSYRHEHKQTQYFIFDANKDQGDPAKIVNPGVAPKDGYSEWVDLNNKHDSKGFGIHGYSSIEDYKNYLTSKLSISMEQLDEILKPLPLTEEEGKLKKYIEDYKAAA